MRLPSLALAAALLLPRLAGAHELWIQREGGAFVLRQGHRGGATVPLDAARVTTVRCADGGGTVRDVRGSARADGGAVRVEAHCAAIAAEVDGGHWSLTPDGEVPAPRTRVAQAIRSWASLGAAKWVDGRATAAARPLGGALELVPASDLSRARTGDKVTVRVLRDGRPVEGAIVAIGHHALGETDRAGEARVRIRAREVECIGASLRVPLRSPEAETLVLEATLSFEVAR